MMEKGKKRKQGTVRKSKEWHPHAKQIKMVELLINPNDRRTKEDKCKEVGVTPKTLWEWMKKPEFVEYMNSQLGKYTDAELPEVWKALMMQCKRGNVNAIKLFFEMKDLVPAAKVKQEVTGKDGGPIQTESHYSYMTDEELQRELEKYKK
jgi:hypothetical protein